MTSKELCVSYLDALNTGNLDKVLSLFSLDAEVSSPLYGFRDVKSFYTELFNDTSRSQTRLLNVFDKSDSSNSAVALHFEYDWTLGNGNLVKFECVDVFQLTSDGQKISKLTIIYDTAHLRADFQKNKVISTVI